MLRLHLRGVVMSISCDCAHSVGKYQELDVQRQEEPTQVFPAQFPKRFDSWDTLRSNESSEVMTSSRRELWGVCACVRLPSMNSLPILGVASSAGKRE